MKSQKSAATRKKTNSQKTKKKARAIIKGESKSAKKSLPKILSAPKGPSRFTQAEVRTLVKSMYKKCKSQ